MSFDEFAPLMLLGALTARLAFAPFAGGFAIVGIGVGVGYAFFDGRGFSDLNPVALSAFACWLLMLRGAIRTDLGKATKDPRTASAAVPADDADVFHFDDVSHSALARAADALAQGDVSYARREIDWLLEDCEAIA